jgi:hypothetical protein
VKEIPLTQGKVTLVDDEDFERVKNLGWCASNAGKGRFYAKARLRGENINKTIFLHRIIANTPNDLKTDHINGDTLDNRKCNLRIVSDSQNNQNKHKTTNKLGAKGVFNNRQGTYYVQITKDKKRYNLGTYQTIKEAIDTYNKKAKELFGEFACLNPLGK